MRKINLAQVFMLMAMMLVIAAGCTKEGPAGPAGQDGTDGTDGVDGNASCIQCHTIEHMTAVEAQYAQSGHAAGNFVGYAGGRKSCAMCHSDEGFRETQHTGADTTAADIPIPTHIQCSTCHDFHQTLDFENDGPDYAMRTNGPVELVMFPDNPTTLDFNNNSNLCVNCHQPRTPAPTGTGDFTITSTHWGPHHGPQGTMLQGIGGAEIGVGYPEPGSSTHTQVGCIGCHMAEYQEGEDGGVGGHTWHVSVAACTQCHEGATSTDINGKQTEIAGLLEDLKDALFTAGVVTEEGEPIVGTYPIVQAQAYYNYAGIMDDRSLGVHNPSYIKQLLTNSINAIN